MALLFWDASGLVKRYAIETGSSIVDTVWAAVPLGIMATTTLGYAETFSVLLRKRNAGRLNQTEFATAVNALRSEVIDTAECRMLAINDAAILDGLSLMEAHNVNATDAAILALLLRYRQLQAPTEPPPVLIAADTRLVRAATAEGLPVLNPEMVPAAGVAAFLATHSIL